MKKCKPEEKDYCLLVRSEKFLVVSTKSLVVSTWRQVICKEVLGAQRYLRVFDGSESWPVVQKTIAGRCFAASMWRMRLQGWSGSQSASYAFTLGVIIRLQDVSRLARD